MESCLGIEKHDPTSINTGNSRNAKGMTARDIQVNFEDAYGVYVLATFST